MMGGGASKTHYSFTVTPGHSAGTTIGEEPPVPRRAVMEQIDSSLSRRHRRMP